MMTAVAPFARSVSPGLTANGRLYVEVRWDGSRLSLSGVDGPKANGNAHGSCGQCRDALDNLRELSPGWTPESVARLRDTWERWHLNDMRAGCEHQRAEGWDKRPIDPSKPLNTYGKHFPGQRQDSWNMLTWIRRDEHPSGLLSHPCPTCGYKFGSAWLNEDVPEDVVEWLAALPVCTEWTPGARAWRLDDLSLTR